MTRRAVLSLIALALTPMTFAEEPTIYSPISKDAYVNRLPFFASAPLPVPNGLQPQDYNTLSYRVLGAYRIRYSGDRQTFHYEFTFPGELGHPVPGFLEVPMSLPMPMPLVLLIHGWTGSKEDWEDEKKKLGLMRKILLDSGFAVVALDAPMHGERVNETDAINQDSIFSYYTLDDVVINSVKDYRRVLDYLLRPKGVPTAINVRENLNVDVKDGKRNADPSGRLVINEIEEFRFDASRVGALGYSLGGGIAFCLLGVDERVKFGVTCVPLLGHEEYVAVKLIDYVWGINGVRANEKDQPPKPIFMLMAENDKPAYYSKKAVDATYDAFIKSPVSKIKWYPSDHELPAEWVTDVADWLKDQKL